MALNVLLGSTFRIYADYHCPTATGAGNELSLFPDGVGISLSASSKLLHVFRGNWCFPRAGWSNSPLNNGKILPLFSNRYQSNCIRRYRILLCKLMRRCSCGVFLSDLNDLCLCELRSSGFFASWRMTISDPVICIVLPRSPSEVFEPIVVLVIIQMTALFVLPWRTNPGEQNKPVDMGSLLLPVFIQENAVVFAPYNVFQSPRLCSAFGERKHVAIVRHIIPGVARNRSVFLTFVDHRVRTATRSRRLPVQRSLLQGPGQMRKRIDNPSRRRRQPSCSRRRTRCLPGPHTSSASRRSSRTCSW